MTLFVFFQRKYDLAFAGLGGSDACPTGDQEVAGLIPTGSSNIFLGD